VAVSIIFLVNTTHATKLNVGSYFPSPPAATSTSSAVPIPDPEDPCATFDPHGDEASDPEGCLRARQWRQIQRFRAISDAE
jgi:hypothetical protein